jgi:glyoxylase I family protein
MTVHPVHKVDGIGGAFFRARDPLKLAHWYREHLGIDSGLDGDTLWTQQAGPTVWAPFPADTEKFGPDQGVMFNFRVRDLDALVQQLQAAGVPIEGDVETQAGAGRFAWIRDPEGNSVELWEPETR